MLDGERVGGREAVEKDEGAPGKRVLPECFAVAREFSRAFFALVQALEPTWSRYEYSPPFGPSPIQELQF